MLPALNFVNQRRVVVLDTRGRAYVWRREDNTYEFLFRSCEYQRQDGSDLTLRADWSLQDYATGYQTPLAIVRLASLKYPQEVQRYLRERSPMSIVDIEALYEQVKKEEAGPIRQYQDLTGRVLRQYLNPDRSTKRLQWATMLPLLNQPVVHLARVLPLNVDQNAGIKNLEPALEDAWQKQEYVEVSQANEKRLAVSERQNKLHACKVIRCSRVDGSCSVWDKGSDRWIRTNPPSDVSSCLVLYWQGRQTYDQVNIVGGAGMTTLSGDGTLPVHVRQYLLGDEKVLMENPPEAEPAVQKDGVWENLRAYFVDPSGRILWVATDEKGTCTSLCETTGTEFREPGCPVYRVCSYFPLCSWELPLSADLLLRLQRSVSDGNKRTDMKQVEADRRQVQVHRQRLLEAATVLIDAEGQTVLWRPM